MSLNQKTTDLPGATISDQAPAKSGRQSAKRWIVLDVIKETVKNVAMGVPAIRAWRLKRPRAGALFTGDSEELERYAFFPTRNLLEVLGDVNGLEIVEIGPGDFLTSGLSLLAAGAKSYTVVDRFVGDYEKPEAKVWYKGIRSAWPQSFPKHPWPEYLKPEDFPESYRDCIEVLDGTIEHAQSMRRYDVVCSYQVGEHVNDIDEFARANARLLNPNGVAVHRVDFGPHDCWSLYPDPLTFLRFPNWLWTCMGSNRGTPNRRRHHEFRRAFENAGLKVEIVSVDHFAAGIVDVPRLRKQFRDMPQDSIAIGTAIYVCRLRSEQ